MEQVRGTENHQSHTNASASEDAALPARAFRLGGIFVAYCFQAEKSWCEEAQLWCVGDREGELDLDQVRRLSGALKNALQKLDVRLENEFVFAKTFDAMDKFLSEYERLYWDERRVFLVRQKAECGPEFYESNDLAIMMGWPLKEQWKRVQNAMNDGISELPKDLQFCYTLAKLLQGALNPTYLGGQRGRDRAEELRYLPGEFQNLVNDNIKALAEYFPCFKTIQFRLEGGDTRNWVHQIRKTSSDLSEMLQDPPRFLGLKLDGTRRNIHRGDKKAHLRGQLPWNILDLLMKGGEEGVPRTALFNAWGNEKELAGDPELSSHLSVIRRTLKPLGIGIHSERNGPCRLCEIQDPAPHAEKAKKSKAKRRARRDSNPGCAGGTISETSHPSSHPLSQSN